MPSVKRVLSTAAAAALAIGPASAAAQISDAILAENKAGFERQATDPDQKRDRTEPRDWAYALPEGVTTRQVTFYVDGGTPLYGKLFFPKGFSTRARYPAVTVGHGINAVSIGIEKYAARFAARGFVAMAIDYQSYGFSGSGSDDLRLLKPDTTTDASPVSEKHVGIQVKRTNLKNSYEIADVRAAVSFLQGEPGIDPERIGIWGTSNGCSIVQAVAAIDARVKAVVCQVLGSRPAPRAPVGIGTNVIPGTTITALDDAIARVRTGQGAEVDGGFSFRTKIDVWSTTRNRDVRPWQTLDQIRTTTAVLYVVAEKDELTNGPGGAIEAAKFLAGRGVPAQAIVLPGLTHFQAYSYTGFKVGSTLAADWLAKYLGSAVSGAPTQQP